MKGGIFLDSTESEGLITELGVSTTDLELAFRVLGDLLASSNGCVGSRTVRRELEEKQHITDAHPLVVALKYFDPESSRERGMPIPNFKFHHLDRSFYSDERYAQELKKQEDATTREADDASRKALAAPLEEPTVSHTNRQEEARLVTYVKRALEELYATDADSEEDPFVFDVHSSRKGSSFENVDIVAVHRRPRNIYDLITVEVKLEFSPQVYSKH